MIAGRRSGSVLVLAVFAAGLAAAWYVYQGLQAPADSGRSAAAAGKQPAVAGSPPVGQSFQLPPLSAFEATLKRPVFSPSRRPKAGAPVVVSQDLALKMEGVSGLDGDKRALLRPEGGDETLQLREGEEYQGWTLSEIGQQHVVFRRDDQELRLEIDFKVAPRPVRMRPGRTAGTADGQGAAQQTRRAQLRQQQQQQLQQRQQQQLQQRQQQLEQQLEQIQEQQQMLQQDQ